MESLRYGRPSEMYRGRTGHALRRTRHALRRTRHALGRAGHSLRRADSQLSDVRVFSHGVNEFGHSNDCVTADRLFPSGSGRLHEHTRVLR